MYLRGALLLALVGLMTPMSVVADYCYTALCRPGIPGDRIWYGCKYNFGVYACCAGEDWDWADGECFTNSQCGEGSFVCYYRYNGTYGADENCCSRE